MCAQGRTRRCPTRDLSSRDLNRHRPSNARRRRPETRRWLISAVRARPRPVVARSDSNRRPTLHPSSPECFLTFVPVVARTVILIPIVARCGPVVARCATCCRDPSRTRSALVRVSPISTCVFSHFSALYQSIPAYACHGDCLRDSPQGAKHFSSHAIHHH